MSISNKYDFVFTGAGCAALSLLVRMIKSGKFSDKKILLIDKEQKNKNDRTWCFWEKETGFFDNIVFKKWDSISFLSDEFSADRDITPYQYKMIRGIDLYDFCFSEIKKQSNIDVIYGDIAQTIVQYEGITIHISGELLHFDNAIIFNSILQKKNLPNHSINLLQHFKGWMIETPQPSFDPSKAVFMDFRVQQKDDTTFAYVLPITPEKALVEYTLFSRQLLPDNEYEAELTNYIENFLQLKEYRIIEKEFGVIPMTNQKFSFYDKDKQIYNIGTAGGQTKASSGYTFQFIQKQSDKIINTLLNNRLLSDLNFNSGRFKFYDKVLLDVLFNKRVSGKKVFTTLFQKNRIFQVLRFLDNESSISKEMKIISSLPIFPFLKAAFRQIK